jgi:hypothetical protein
MTVLALHPQDLWIVAVVALVWVGLNRLRRRR